MSVDLRCGDCLQVLTQIEAYSVDMVLTSPPYDHLRAYDGYTFNFEGIAAELARVLKPGGMIVWVTGDACVKGSETGTSFRQALHFMSLGLNLHDTMIFQKQNPAPQNHIGRYEQAFEYMFCFSKGKPKTGNMLMVPSKYAGQANRGGTYYQNKVDPLPRPANKECAVNPMKRKSNVWQYLVGNHGREAQYKHPAKFPKQLALDHIQSWSNPGDTVLDPMMGSGTTGIAALELRRKFIGIEISENYFQMASERLKGVVCQ